MRSGTGVGSASPATDPEPVELVRCPKSNNSANPPPASSILDQLLWEWLKPAFGRYVAFAGGSIVGARDEALDHINRDVHEWRLRLGFRAPDDTIKVPDAAECQKLTVNAAPTWEEAVWIEPRRDERCYAWRADLDRRTTLPAAPAAHAGGELKPAARVEESMPEPAPAVEPEPAPLSPQVEPEPPSPLEPELAKAEYARWQLDPAIKAMKSFYPPDGIRPKSVSIAKLTERINKLPEFKSREVSEDTVRRADIEIKAARKK